MSVYTKIQTGEYESKLPYPGRGEEPAERRRKKQAYAKERADLDWQFYLDLLDHDGLCECSYHRAVFNYAWDRYKDSGLSEVVVGFEELMDLLDKLQLLKDEVL